MGNLLLFKDTPITDPDNDLLGMNPYAEQLARFLNALAPPFTVGIYGEWGEGKTSFVELACCHINLFSDTASTSKFIKFSAWPHANSDDLWRALILEIANALYAEEIRLAEQLAATDQSRDRARSGNLRQAVSSFLSSDAVVIKKSESSPDPLGDYKQLLTMLDRTPPKSISKDPQQQLQIDQQQALIAVAKILGSSIAAFSPFAAGIQKLLGLNSEVNLSDLFRQERNESTREGIKSLNDFIEAIQEAFAKQARGKRVFIFIDDLDRCLPDVALDILEAIKVFLGKVNAVFIVAADEALIGKGLRLRYRDLPDMSIDFSRKGNEYFEKIIQFSIRVPTRTREQTHKFISAQFPQWVPVTDIIEAATGTNPRRLKQSGNRLTFEYNVLLTSDAGE